MGDGMPALNFRRQFARLVRDGTKRQTIRKARKRPIQPGDKLVLYTGMRTKACQKLLDAQCVSVDWIRIAEDRIEVNSVVVPRARMTEIAQADGFQSVKEFRTFFRDLYGLPFTGQLIRWNQIRCEAPLHGD